MWNRRLVVLAAGSMFLVLSGPLTHAQQQAARRAEVARPVSYSTETVLIVPSPYGAAYSTCPPNVASGHGGRLRYPKAGAVWWLLDDRYYALSPDHGWTRVVKRPIERQNVTYQNYWPSQWYGQVTPQYPIVAAPTDTTQLGYYYQHVPQWQPKPGMLPARPVPAQWHIRECQQPCIYVSTAVEAPKADAKAPAEAGEKPAPPQREKPVPPPAPVEVPSAGKTAAR